MASTETNTSMDPPTRTQAPKCELYRNFKFGKEDSKRREMRWMDSGCTPADATDIVYLNENYGPPYEKKVYACKVCASDGLYALINKFDCITRVEKLKV